MDQEREYDASAEIQKLIKDAEQAWQTLVFLNSGI